MGAVGGVGGMVLVGVKEMGVDVTDLGVVAVGPFEAGGHAGEHLWEFQESAGVTELIRRNLEPLL